MKVSIIFRVNFLARGARISNWKPFFEEIERVTEVDFSNSHGISELKESIKKEYNDKENTVAREILVVSHAFIPKA